MVKRFAPVFDVVNDCQTATDALYESRYEAAGNLSPIEELELNTT